MDSFEITRAQEIEADKQMREAGITAIKIAKMFADLILSLPDDFGGPLTQEVLDKIAEPRAAELYLKIKEGNYPVEAIKAASDIVSIFSEVTVRSCDRYTRNDLREIYRMTFGVYEPEKEMKVGDIAVRKAELLAAATKDAMKAATEAE